MPTEISTNDVKGWCLEAAPDWNAPDDTHIQSLTYYLSIVKGTTPFSFNANFPIRKRRKSVIKAIETLIADLPSLIDVWSNAFTDEQKIRPVERLLEAAHSARGVFPPVPRGKRSAPWNTTAFMIYLFVKRGWMRTGRKTVGTDADSPAVKVISKALEYLDKSQTNEAISKALKRRRDL